jgi:hypothetical protein
MLFNGRFFRFVSLSSHGVLKLAAQMVVLQQEVKNQNQASCEVKTGSAVYSANEAFHCGSIEWYQSLQ